MKFRLSSLLITLLGALALFGEASVRDSRIRCSAGSGPLLQMRIRADETATEEIWRSNLVVIAEHPGCCDEIWFSTGIGVPGLDWHRARAEILAKAVADVRKMGIVPSLQFQATLGHGDEFVTPDMCSAKMWTGWTDWKGRETQYCNCPRQPAFHAYLAEVARAYARVGFSSLWVDDDLRYRNHKPADNAGVHVGCWCDVCIGAFNKETNGTWTREELGKAVETDQVLASRWRTFAIDGLCQVARTIAVAFRDVSPSTMMGLQSGNWEDAVDPVRAILKTLHETSGCLVGCRPGGGAYYDDDPNGIIRKSLKSARFRSRIGDPGYVKLWTPEIESWPRTYYSRSPQGVLAEGFVALMHGMNGMSFFISNSTMENPSLYGETFWTTLAEAAPVLHGYSNAIKGCTAVGFSNSDSSDVGIRRTAIPVLAGPGRSVGELTKPECELNVNTMTSADVQKFRDEIDRRAGGLPAEVCSPFVGLVQIHVDAQGKLRSVALMNLRISRQGAIRLLLRNVPPAWQSVEWNEMRHPPLSLELERIGEEKYVTVPSIDAWNGGWIGKSCLKPGDGCK